MKSVYEAVIIGASAGGMNAFEKLFSGLPGTFPLMIIAVQHLHPTEGGYIVEHLGRTCTLPVVQAEDKCPIIPGHIYLAPANYHLLVEKDMTVSLNIDARVNYARPSIDVAFESAARVWTSRLIGILLTGANHDGACGLARIREYGGLTIAQDPATAESPVMPKSAIDMGAAAEVMNLGELAAFLARLGTPNTLSGPFAEKKRRLLI